MARKGHGRLTTLLPQSGRSATPQVVRAARWRGRSSVNYTDLEPTEIIFGSILRASIPRHTRTER
jgi:hypothetical protein